MTAMTSPSSSPRTGSARLGWLDLLRGIAALVVALHHASFYFVEDFRASMGNWFDPGDYGVLVFFLVSGYIIPASLERHGQVRSFWISRLLRIYPMLLVACTIMVLPFLLGVRDLRAGLSGYNPATAVLAHLTMMQDALDVPNVINVLWTLSYEMLFYLLVVALFVTNQHRRSAPIAVGLVLAAIVVGPLLPSMALSKSIGIGPVVLLTVLVMAAAIAGTVSGRPDLTAAGGIIGGALAAVLILLNSRVGAWESLEILAVMFAGTVIYRVEHGQISTRAGVLTCGAVLIGAIGAAAWDAHMYMSPAQEHNFDTYWTGSILLATATFAAGWTLRHRQIPRWLTALGTISFSLYLIHPILLMFFDQFSQIPEDHSDPIRLLIFLALLLAASGITYRYIEAPFQRLSRRLTHRPTTVVPRPETLPAADPTPTQ